MKKDFSKKSNPVEENRWINVHDDDIIKEMGFNRPELQATRDKSVWTKTSQERRLLRRYAKWGKDGYFHSSPFKMIPVKSRLIVYLTKNNGFEKSTHSIVCWQHDIPAIISRFCKYDPKTESYINVVRKYSWNGKTYDPSEIPFWK